MKSFPVTVLRKFEEDELADPGSVPGFREAAHRVVFEAQSSTASHCAVLAAPGSAAGHREASGVPSFVELCEMTVLVVAFCFQGGDQALSAAETEGRRCRDPGVPLLRFLPQPTRVPV